MEKPDTTKKQTIIGDVVAHIKPSTKLLPYVHPNIVMECLIYIRTAQQILIISSIARCSRFSINIYPYKQINLIYTHSHSELKNLNLFSVLNILHCILRIKDCLCILLNHVIVNICVSSCNKYYVVA